MPKKAARREPQPGFWSRVRINLGANRQREILALVLIGLGSLTLLALFQAGGIAGDWWAGLLRKFLGVGAFAAAVVLVVAGLLLLRHRENVFDEFPLPWGQIVALEIFFAAGLALLHVYQGGGDESRASALAEAGMGGGYLGWAVSSLLFRATGSGVGTALLVLLLLIGLRFMWDWSPATGWIVRRLPQAPPTRAPARRGTPTPAATRPDAQNLAPRPSVSPGDRVQPSVRAVQSKEIEKETAPRPARGVGTSPLAPLFGKKPEPHAPPAPPLLTEVYGIQVLATRPPVAPARALEGPKTPSLPRLDLLSETSEAKFAETDAARKARVIEETLDQFGVPAKVIETNAGPTVTQFGLEPGFVERRGLDGKVMRRRVPVSRIQALSNDLALALAAAPIRIEAPVPGRSMVGIEVPNESISVVSLRGVMESEAFKKIAAKTPLPIALGKDVSGNASVADMVGMPHLLIAGATGSGKSVCINAIIACLLFSMAPDDLRLVMVDPKRVELVNFNGIPHLVGPVITEVPQVVDALRWAVREMENRLRLFSTLSERARASVRNIEAYNRYAERDTTGKAPPLPYLLIIIDELADLMLAAPDETEKLITRLAQLARATGIHLILATQRPSVDVVTGLIKANFPARISFAVTSAVDSRVVLDTPGAEKLLGRGDMLFMAPDSAKLARLQGCFVSDDELARLVNFWRQKAVTELHYVASRAPWNELAQTNGSGGGEDEGDELIERATEVIRTTQTASTSFLQRKLGIGYPRAARLMDQLEERGIVGPDQGGGRREILSTEEPTKRKK